MTTIGHSLTGLSLAALILPPDRSRRWYLAMGGCFVLFANLPDLPFPGWGHSAYHVSHSIFVALLLSTLLALLSRTALPQVTVSARIMLAFSLAWLSHMVLDSLYAHGRGLAVYWPFSDAHLALPVAWFNTLSMPARSDANLRVFAIESLVFGVLLAVSLLLRQILMARRRA